MTSTYEKILAQIAAAVDRLHQARELLGNIQPDPRNPRANALLTRAIAQLIDEVLATLDEREYDRLVAERRASIDAAVAATLEGERPQLEILFPNEPNHP